MTRQVKKKPKIVPIQILVDEEFRKSAHIAALKLGTTISIYLRECLERLIKDGKKK